jgi:Uma2 family endonuclease
MLTQERVKTRAQKGGAAGHGKARRSLAPRPLRWNKDQYYRMAELGWFEGRRVELIEGEIIEMAAMKSPHAAIVTQARYGLERALGIGFIVRVQTPLDFGEVSQPEPDLAVVAFNPTFYYEAHPDTALLVVEVSDTTLAYDRSVKAALYAKKGIPDYWILNLGGRQLEILRQPVRRSRGAWGYAQKIILRAGDSIAPLCAPEASIAVADLLPRAA